MNELESGRIAIRPWRIQRERMERREKQMMITKELRSKIRDLRETPRSSRTAGLAFRLHIGVLARSYLRTLAREFYAKQHEDPLTAR